MDNQLINHIVEVAMSIIVGIFIINFMCNAFLGFDLVGTVQKLIARITKENKEDEE